MLKKDGPDQYALLFVFALAYGSLLSLSQDIFPYSGDSDPFPLATASAAFSAIVVAMPVSLSIRISRPLSRRTAAGENHAFIYDISCEFGRRSLQRRLYPPLRSP